MLFHQEIVISVCLFFNLSYLRLFVIAWNLTATFHIYNVKPTFDDASSLSYCHPSPYYLAFVLVILFDVLIAIVLFIWVSALLAGQYQTLMHRGLKF